MSDGFKYKYNPDSLLPYKVKKQPIFLIRCILVSLLLLLSYQIAPSQKLLVTLFPKKYVDPFTEKNLLDSLVSWNIYFPNVVLAQMKIETGNFNSQLFKKTNNLMGMTFPKTRRTTAVGSCKIFDSKYNEYYSYAVYNNWVESAKDYAIFQKLKFNENYYYKFLTNVGYAEDINYISKLKQINEEK